MRFPGFPLAQGRSRRAFRGCGEGSPLPTSFSPRGTGFPYPAPTPQHSGDGGGGARLQLQLPFVPRGMVETRRPCWASRGRRTARGDGLFRETPVLRCAGSLGARAERVGRDWPFLEESQPTGFFVCNLKLAQWLCRRAGRQGSLETPAGFSPFLCLGPQSLQRPLHFSTALGYV